MIRVVKELLYRMVMWGENKCYTHTYWPVVVLALILEGVIGTGYHLSVTSSVSNAGVFGFHIAALPDLKTCNAPIE